MSEDYYAGIYENETIAYAKEYPHINEGMLVRVYDANTGDRFMCHGVIVRGTMYWDSFYYQYIVDVMTAKGVMPGVLAGRLEREVHGKLRGVPCQ